jgi:hypothetical protein
MAHFPHSIKRNGSPGRELLKEPIMDTQTHELQVTKPDSLQMLPIAEAQDWYNNFVAFSKSILKPDLDFGIIPGTPKPSLYKPGAEKLRFVYGLGVEMRCIDKTVDIHTPFLDFTYRCTVKSKTGQILAECEGSCNSMEKKYGHVWKSEHELPPGTDTSKLVSKASGKKISEFDFSINKAETTGKYGKAKEYWDMWLDAIEAGTAKKIKKKSFKGNELDAWEMDNTQVSYRLTNPDVMDLKNTIMKMAQKRAFVGAILLATGASEFFTQDVEDLDMHGPAQADNQPPAHFEDATVVDESTQDAFLQWLDKLKECKTPQAVDDLALQNKDVISNWPELKNAFTQHKALLRKNAAVPL